MGKNLVMYLMLASILQILRVFFLIRRDVNSAKQHSSKSLPENDIQRIIQHELDVQTSSNLKRLL